MPILSYFAVVGSVLVALLFVAYATMDKHGPMPFNSEFAGMPKPWRAETPNTILAATPAPEPDMKSEAVLAAAPPAPQVAEASPKTEAVKPEHIQPAKKVVKRVAHKQQPRPDDD